MLPARWSGRGCAGFVVKAVVSGSARPAELPALPKVVLFVFWSALLHLVLIFVLDDLLRGGVPGKATVLQLRLAAQPAARSTRMPAGKEAADDTPDETESSDIDQPESIVDDSAGGLAGTDYYREADELDVQPVPLGPVVPVYPDDALDTGMAGYADLLIMIDEDGAVHSIEVVESSPPGTFDEAALMAFKAVPFAPGQKGLMPVKSRIVIRVEFSAGAPAE